MKIARIVSAVKQRIYKAIYRGRKNDTCILMLHEVTDGEPAKYPEISIEKDAFGTIDSAVNKQTILKNPYYIPRACVSNQSADEIVGAL